jgi:toxin ParE1/3/4
MKKKQFSIELSNDAEIDFDNSYEFYFNESPQVADAFFKRINLSFEHIKKNPYSFPIVHENLRKFMV